MNKNVDSWEPLLSKPNPQLLRYNELLDKVCEKRDIPEDLLITILLGFVERIPDDISLGRVEDCIIVLEELVDMDDERFEVLRITAAFYHFADE